jgi:hypothetical protein
VLPRTITAFQADEIVGRIYPMSADRELWRWMIRVVIRT